MSRHSNIEKARKFRHKKKGIPDVPWKRTIVGNVGRRKKKFSKRPSLFARLDGEHWKLKQTKRTRKKKFLRNSSSNMRLINIPYHQGIVLKKGTVCSKCKVGHLNWVDENDIKGLGSRLTYECDHCGSEISAKTSQKVHLPLKYTGKSRKSSTYGVNTSAIIGTSSSGIANEKLNNFLPFLGLRNISKNTYRRQQNSLLTPIRELTQETMDKNLELEKKLTLERGTVIQDEELNGMVGLHVTCDGYWQCRGSGHGKNSKTGGVNLIGKETGKIIDSVQFSKQCQQCAYDKRRGTKTSHVCGRNFDENLSSGAMETIGLCIMLNRSRDRGYEVRILGGDEDVKQMVEVKKCVVYGHLVEKRSDKNHFEKGTRKLVVEMQMRDFNNKDVLSEVNVRKITKYVKFVVRQNQNNVENLEKDFLALPLHLCQDHSKCRKIENGGWCKGERDEHILRFKGDDIQRSLQLLCSKLIGNKTKLANLSNTNPNEQSHSVIASVCPKSLHHGQSSKYEILMRIGICKFNDGNDVGLKLVEKMELPMDEVNVKQIKENREKQKKRLNYNKLPRTRKNVAMRRLLKSRTSREANKRSGIVYESGCGLNDVSGMKEMYLKDVSSIFPEFDVKKQKKINKKFYKKKNLKKKDRNLLSRVFFGDTETTGRRNDDTYFDISLSQVSNKKPFQTYANPDEIISPSEWSKKAILVHGVKPSDNKIGLAPTVEQVNREMMERAEKFSKKEKPIFIFKNIEFDKRMISKDPDYQDRAIWIEGESFLSPVPLDILPKGNRKQENLSKFYLNNMQEDSGQHSSSADTRQLKDLTLKNCGSVENFSVILKDAMDQRNSGVKCKCSINGKCKRCICSKKGQKCGILCSCKGNCDNASKGAKKLRKYQKKLVKRKRKVYNRIIKKNPLKQFLIITKSRKKGKRKRKSRVKKGEKKRKLSKNPVQKNWKSILKECVELGKENVDDVVRILNERNSEISLSKENIGNFLKDKNLEGDFHVNPTLDLFIYLDDAEEIDKVIIDDD